MSGIWVLVIWLFRRRVMGSGNCSIGKSSRCWWVKLTVCGDSPCPYARSDPRRHFGVSNSRLIEKQESVKKMKSGGHRQVVSKEPASPGVCHLPYGTNTPLIATTMTSSSARKKVESIQASMRDPESPIFILLNSNNNPNDSETILIKECIVAAEETTRGLQGTDSESLSDASQTLEGTRNQEHLQELTEIIRLHKSLLSSSRLLPNELLIEIFLFFAQPEDLTTYVAPWVLGHICRRWRNISLSQCPHYGNTFPQFAWDIPTRPSRPIAKDDGWRFYCHGLLDLPSPFTYTHPPIQVVRILSR